MFDISWGKLVIIGVVALLVIGPKELPAVLRQLGQWMTKIRRMAAEFQGQFNEAMREAEMADLKKTFDETTSSVTSALDPSTYTSDMEKLIQSPGQLDSAAGTPPPARAPRALHPSSYLPEMVKLTQDRAHVDPPHAHPPPPTPPADPTAPLAQ